VPVQLKPDCNDSRELKTAVKRDWPTNACRQPHAKYRAEESVDIATLAISTYTFCN
jgi:hypothetical protein